MSSQTLAPAAKKKYTPLFRSLTETICAKKLKRNELLVVIFLLEKTLGFGKPRDQLTTGLIAYRTGIRKDRVKSAIQGVLATGLFERKASPRFEYEYQIGQAFLDQHKGHFFAPALPKNGAAFRKTEDFSENRGHTALYPDNSLPSHKLLPLHLQDNNIEDDFSNNENGSGGQRVNTLQHRQSAPELNPPDSAQMSHQATAVNVSAQKNMQDTAQNHYSSSLTQPPPNIQDTASNHCSSSLMQPLPNMQDTALNHCSNLLVEPAIDGVQTSCNWHLSLKLPASLHPANQGSIMNIFKQGTEQQALDTLIVFDDMERKGLVRHTPFLLKTLALASQIDQLIMPDPQQPVMAKKTTLPPVPNALDDSLTRYAEKYHFSAPRQAADFTYYFYRDLLRKERRERLAKTDDPIAVPPTTPESKNTETAPVNRDRASDLALLI